MLKKELGFWGVFCIAAGAMISSGLFVLPGLAFAKSGPSMIVSYALAAVLVVPVMLAKAELSTAMPRSGGSYFFVGRSLGPLLGTITGLMNWFSIALKAAFALVGAGALCWVLFPSAGEQIIKLVAIGGCVLFTALNLLSVKEVGRLQVVLVFGLLLIIGAYVALGFGHIQQPRYMPFLPEGKGLQDVFAVAGMVFISFGGLTKIASVAEEVENPGRNLPYGMFLAFAVVSFLYVTVIFVTVGVVEPKTLSGSLMPLHEGSKVIYRHGPIAVGIGALLAFVTTANAGIMAASRSPLAMSRDGLMPAFFAKTNKRFGTPHVAVILTSVFMMVVIAFLSVEDLVKTASTIMILMFALENISLIVMRASRIEGYRPSFKAPLSPWLQIISVLIYGFLIFEMGTVPLLLTGGLSLGATLWYLFYVQRRVDLESGVVHLVTRITSKKLPRTGLENELRGISLERDGVEFDRFDKLIHGGLLLDLEEKMSAKELFKKLADQLSSRLKIDSSELSSLFLERERDSTTVIAPGLAIPHIIVEGDGVFDVLVARCKNGVTFSELSEPVTTVFAIIGSRDERNFHLKVLMTIAHIVQEPDFKERWMNARNIEQLRDLILLSSRKRML